jgi:hypothetical protein
MCARKESQAPMEMKQKQIVISEIAGFVNYRGRAQSDGKK